MHRGIDGMFAFSSGLCSRINKDSRIWGDLFLNEVMRQIKHTQMKEQVLSVTSARKKLANVLYQADEHCSNQTTFW